MFRSCETMGLHSVTYYAIDTSNTPASTLLWDWISANYISPLPTASREVQMVGGARQRWKGWRRKKKKNQRTPFSLLFLCHLNSNRPLSQQWHWFQPPTFISIPKPALSCYLRGTRSSQIGPFTSGLIHRASLPSFFFFKQLYQDIIHIPLNVPM